MSRFVGRMENFIFLSRWLQAPLYLGLIVAQGVYVVHFMQELWHLVSSVGQLSETQIMLIVLGLIDVVMIANLLIMVIIGGYETFVSKIEGLDTHVDRPEWLAHVDAGVLKVKLALALISISSIHLLKTFISASTMDGVNPEGVKLQLMIHASFLISAVVVAFTDKLAVAKFKEH
jgi:uncharacterized protein (TIGR00645 family)